MTQSRQERVLIVNESNNPIGSAPKNEVWAGGLWHRIVRVIIKTPSGLILSQQRAENMELYPGYWTDSAGGHVDIGEPDLAAASRELLEETGLRTPLHYVGVFAFEDVYEDKKIYNYNVVFTGLTEDSDAIKPSAEGKDIRWMSIKELMDGNGIVVTPTLYRVLEMIQRDDTAEHLPRKFGS